MLDAREPLFLSSGHQLAVHNRGRTSVAVIGIDSND